MTIDCANDLHPTNADATSDVLLGFRRLSDDTLRRAAIYIAGGLVVDGVVLAVRNVGYEHHTWWGWLLVGVPLTWLSFLGLVALTFTALRGMAGILCSLLASAARMSASAGGVARSVSQCWRSVGDLTGPGAVEPHRIRT